ncbi:MAG: DEAD/DEAH box helicase [Promethearchaeota archaeon]
MPDPHLEPQLLLPLPQNLIPTLYLSCPSLEPLYLLPAPHFSNQSKFYNQIKFQIKNQKKILQIISSYFIEKLAKRHSSQFFNGKYNLNKFFLELSFFNQLFKNSYQVFSDILRVNNNTGIYKRFNPRINERITNSIGNKFFINKDQKINHQEINHQEINVIRTDLNKSNISFSEILKENYRLSFKVQPPAIGRKRWVLSLYLQSREDPSLLIPIDHLGDKCFQNNKNQNPTDAKFNFPNSTSLDRNALHPYIEEDLKRVASIFKPIGQFERNPNKIKVFLSLDQTYTFLKQIVPLLQKKSYGVLIPDWWGKPEFQLGIKLQIKKRDIKDVNLGLLGEKSQLEYNWQISLGKNEITSQEFSYLVSLKEPLLKWKGKWVELESKEIDNLLEFIKSNKIGKKQKQKKRNCISLKKSLELSIGKNRLEEGVRVVDVEFEKDLVKIFNRFKQPKYITPINTPKTFQGTLRPYQQTGLSWLVFMSELKFGACLADDMGLGKTIQVLAYLLYQHENYQKVLNEYKSQGKNRKRNRKNLGPSIIVCPLTLLKNWAQETEKFTPSLNYYIHYGKNRVGGKSFLKRLETTNIVITTYQQVKKDKYLLSRIHWENIILDEAQNIKNYYTQQTKAIKSLKGNFRMGLTGTPIENRLRELWSIMDFLNPGFLCSLRNFNDNYCFPIEKKNDQTRLTELKHLLHPFILRRLKSDNEIIQDLPNKHEQKIYAHLTSEQATLYQASVNHLMAELQCAEGISRSGIILTTLMKLKQICNHPSQFLHEKNPWNLEDQKNAQWYQSKFQERSGKLNILSDMLKKIINKKEKAVIFTQFTQMGYYLQSFLSKTLQTEILFLNGSTPSITRDLMIQQFQQANKSPLIFILSLKAGGVGLNLTAANHVFHYDRWWNPAVEDQASDRVYRIGQNRDVTITKFISVGTIEEKIDLMIEKKKKLSQDILNTGMKWISNISTDELRTILTLGRNSTMSGLEAV